MSYAPGSAVLILARVNPQVLAPIVPYTENLSRFRQSVMDLPYAQFVTGNQPEG